MATSRNQKRKSRTDHLASDREHSLRRSQRLLAAGRTRREVQSSSSPSQTSQTPAAPAAPVAALPHRRRDEIDHHTSLVPSEDEQKKDFTFFSFPGEIRNMIYDYSLYYPDSRQLYASYYRRPAINKASPTWQPSFRAPTILLLNKRIKNECLQMLKSTPLVIDRLPPPRTLPDSEQHVHLYDYQARIPRLSHFMRLSDFISPHTLQSIPQIDINIGLCEGPLGSGWAWLPVVDELISILTQRNACVKLHFLIRLCNTGDYPMVALSDRDYQHRMIRKIQKFADVNPNVFAQPEVKVDVWMIKGQKAKYESSRSFPEPMLVLEDGEIYDLDRPEKEPVPATRRYPDKEMFPGSVMEFVQTNPNEYYSDEDLD